MADQIRQELMQLAGQNPAFLQQARAQLSEVAKDPDIQAEDLPEIISALEGALRNPASYPEVIARFEREGFIDQGDLPSQFDPEVVVALLVTFYLLQDELSGERGFAKGGLAEAAEKVRRAGRDGDTILAHINPAEARLLKAAGGSGTINPETGLPEFKWYKKALKVLAPVALNIIAPGLGTAIGSAIGLSGTAAAVAGSALIGGAVSKLSGGSFAQGALGGAIGGGLGGLAGSATNQALNLGLGAAGQQALGGAITGAAQSALGGGNILQGALGGGLAGFGGQMGGLGGAALQGAGGAIAGGGDLVRGAFSGIAGFGGSQLGGNIGSSLNLGNEYRGALSGAFGQAAGAGAAGGDVGRALIGGALSGSGVGKKIGSSLSSLITPFKMPTLQELGDKYAQGSEEQQDPNDPLNLAPGKAYAGGASVKGPFTPIPGTFRVAPAEQVKLWAQGSGQAGSMQGISTQLPVFSPVGDQNYVQRFINTAETGGYLNPNWSTYRPGVQLLASGNPTQIPGESGAQAYVPNFRTPRTADSVMLVRSDQYTPEAAANVLGHELYHTKQPSTERSVYAGSPGGLQTYQQNLANVIPYLQEKYGYSGAYDTQTNKVPLMERMADLQSFQFNKGIDFAADPEFQKRVFGNDPYARAAWNASTVERTTRLDPRDLPPGQVTSSDFGPGGAPLTFRAQEWLKKQGFAAGGEVRGYAEGGKVENLDRPYIGYRSAGRRPERQQDRVAAANAPLAAIRGMISGALGAPGDIESLVRMLPGLSEQTVLPTSEDIERRLPLRSVSETPAGRAFTTAGQLGGGGYMGPGSPLRAIAALPSAVSRAGRDFVMASGQPAVNVVKPKGGNWLAGSIEREIAPMRTVDPAMMDVLRNADPRFVDQAALNRVNAEGMALDKWLETKLAKYIRNEMATPEDPIRALAESWPARQQELLAAKQVQIDKAVADMEKARAARGFTPEMMTSSQARIRELEKERELIAAREALHSVIEPTGYNVARARREAGFPEEGMGVSPLAKTWEDRADTFVNVLRASDMTSGHYPQAVEANPWLLKVPPETPVYEMLSGSEGQFGGLGFGHLADELRNALNPASGLPENLLLKYADLEKKTVPDIVNQVADINAWRAVQKAEVDKARSSNVATQIFKEYPESPQGLRWVELRLPKETGKKTTVERSELDELGMGVDDATLREVAEEMAFDEGLEEGTQAFNDFVDATIRFHNTKKPVEVDESVKALEDALKYEGEVLKHCVGGYCPDVIEGRSRIYSLRDKKGQPHVTIEVRPPNKEYTDTDEVVQRFWETHGRDPVNKQELMDFEGLAPEIVQIKGKANRAPNPEYLPAVQDFVRSQNWSNVGDLKNTGLVDLQQMGVPAEMRGGQRFVTEDEYKDIVRKNAEGFAEGGLVDDAGGANFPTDDFDPDRIESIVGELHAMNAG